jgi:hypothetical protein
MPTLRHQLVLGGVQLPQEIVTVQDFHFQVDGENRMGMKYTVCYLKRLYQYLVWFRQPYQYEIVDYRMPCYSYFDVDISRVGDDQEIIGVRRVRLREDLRSSGLAYRNVSVEGMV